jgi:FMN-dependent NADH-azoreductase
MPYIRVDVDLDEFDTTNLIEELKRRDYQVFPDPLVNESVGNSTLELIEQIYQLRRTGQDYQQKLDRLIYLVLDKIV